MSHLNFNHPTRIIKIIGIICFFFIIIGNILAFLNPQQGYELSFYSSTPGIIFILIGICILGGIIIIFHQAYYEYYRTTKFWLIGLFLLLITRISILYLPYIRNYYCWMGDNSTHFGIVKEIISGGYVNQTNFYPFVHIFLAEFQIFTSMPIEFTINHSTAFLSVLFILSTYLLAKSIFTDEKPILLTLAATGCVIFSQYEMYLMPNGWSCLYLPFALYLILKSINSENCFSFKILAIIVMIMYPFFHPLSTLLLIFLLILIIIFQYLIKIPQISGAQKDRPRINTPWILLSIISVVWIPWLISFRIFEKNIENIISSIITGETIDVIGGISGKLDKMNLNTIDFTILFLKQFGDELIFLVLFLIGLVIIFKYSKLFKNFENIIILALVVFFFGMLYFLYLFSIFPGLGSFNAQRIISYIILTTPIFTGIVYTYATSKRKIFINILCVFIIILPPLLTLFAIFPSPYIYNPTPEITQMDLKGMNWTFTFKDIDIPSLYIMSPPNRFADIILGINGRNERPDIGKYVYRMPDHFNYNRNPNLGNTYSHNYYAVITKFDTIIYDTVYSPVGRFHNSDFKQLQIDNTVERIYSNNETTVYYILGQN